MTFDEIIPRLLRREGGYVNDPNDAGGETKFGISKRQYPSLDIRNLSIGKAREIYLRDYWEKFAIEKLPAPIREIFFDMCVLQGIGAASLILQRAINHGRSGGRIAEDGIVGTVTRREAEGLDLAVLRAYRVKFLNDLVLSKPSYRKFWRGWMNRAVNV
jgi:lysozyme family protein